MRVTVISRGGPAGVLALLLIVLGAPTGAQSPATGGGGAAAENPYAATGAVPGSGAGLIVGYLAGNRGDPIDHLVTQGVVEEAAIAGVVLVRCGTDVTAQDPVECAAELRQAAVDGVIVGDVDVGLAAAVCAADGRVPTVSLGSSPSPCGGALVTTDAHGMGRLAGARVGAAVADGRGCAFDLVAMLAGRPGAEATSDGLTGLVEGFESVCGPVPEDRRYRLDAVLGDGSVGTRVSELVATLPQNGLLVLLSDGDEAALEALAAVDAAGRADSVRIGAIGGSLSAWRAIGCHPSWVADATSFPERYGRTLVPAIIDLVIGQDVAALMTFPVAVLDRDTIRSYYPDVPSC